MMRKTHSSQGKGEAEEKPREEGKNYIKRTMEKKYMTDIEATNIYEAKHKVLQQCKKKTGFK